ncbi:MAG: LysR family transcriptional regulator [Myxococcota bacterium]
MTDFEQRLDACWRWLPVFVHLADTENVGVTAKALFTTPPSISRALKNIEEALGVPLFERTGNRIFLNASGQALLAVAKPALERIRGEVVQLSDNSGHFTIGASVLLGQWLGMPLLKSLIASDSALVSRITDVHADNAHEGLASGSLDLFLGYEAVGAPFLSQVLGTVEFALYATPEHPLAERTQLAREEVLEHSFAVVQRCPRIVGQVWPADQPRKVRFVGETSVLTLEAAKTLNLLVAVPCIQSPLLDGLVRLDCPPVGRLTATVSFRRTGRHASTGLRAAECAEAIFADVVPKTPTIEGLREPS